MMEDLSLICGRRQLSLNSFLPRCFHILRCCEPEAAVYFIGIYFFSKNVRLVIGAAVKINGSNGFCCMNARSRLKRFLPLRLCSFRQLPFVHLFPVLSSAVSMPLKLRPPNLQSECFCMPCFQAYESPQYVYYECV